MSSPLVLAGLGFGLLATATAASAWLGLGQPDETWRVSTARGVRLIGWLTTPLLLAAGWGLWANGHTLSALSLRLAILGAVAAPAACDAACRHWSSVLGRLPGVILAGLALSQITALPLDLAGSPALEATPVVSLGLLICGGLAARTVGEAFDSIATPRPDHGWWTPAAVYALLTVLTGGTAFYSLVRYGSLWTSAALVTALAAIWLAWSAMWLGKNVPFRLHTGLTCASGLLLVWTALIIG